MSIGTASTPQADPASRMPTTPPAIPPSQEPDEREPSERIAGESARDQRRHYRDPCRHERIDRIHPLGQEPIERRLENMSRSSEGVPGDRWGRDLPQAPCRTPRMPGASPHPVRQLPSLRSRDDASSTRPQSTSAVRIRSPFNRGERQSHDAAASRCDLGILCGVAPESALGPRAMERVRDTTHRCHIGPDTGRENGKGRPMVDGSGWTAVVRVEVMELRVVQVAALGWRPRRVGCYSDNAPVGALLSLPVFREALSGLPNAAMSMAAASALVPDRGVDVRFRRHSRSLSNYRSRVGVRQGSKPRANFLSWRGTCPYALTPATRRRGVPSDVRRKRVPAWSRT